MVRRRLTLKRIDPWSVLKFGFVANLSLLAIWLLGAGVVWFFIQRLQLIAKVCEIATEMGFVECGVNGGNLFRAVLLLGLLGVIIQTGLLVFLAFLYNLIADLVGGLTFSFVDDTPGAAARGETPATAGPAKTSGVRSSGGAAKLEDKDRTVASPAARPEPKPAGTPAQQQRPASTGSSSSNAPTERTTPASSSGSNSSGGSGGMWGDRSSQPSSASGSGSSGSTTGGSTNGSGDPTRPQQGGSGSGSSGSSGSGSGSTF